MSVEFTGERVIPGLVDPDLWNEHFSRYSFAARYAQGRRVLDVGCGTGYGTAELGRTAAYATGIDIGDEAVAYAIEHYKRDNIAFRKASATSLPFEDGSFDLVVAFEVIEHLPDWPELLREARRVLAPGGQLLVSTPNKLYYSETRQESGPNPFHTHEFEFEEYRSALREFFPHVSLVAENHTAGIVFQPHEGSAAAAVHLESKSFDPESAHFFVALCSLEPHSAPAAYVYIPSVANTLREREIHIRRLEKEIAQKNKWLQQAQKEHRELLALHEQTLEELRSSNLWAQKSVDDLATERARFVEIQEAYEQVQRNNEAELSECRKHFHEAERLVEERTLWAQSLDREVESLRGRINTIGNSKWYRVGRRLGLGPEV